MLYERGKLRTLLFKGPIVSFKTDNPIPENCAAIGTDILKTNEDGAPHYHRKMFYNQSIGFWLAKQPEQSDHDQSRMGYVKLDS